MSSDPPSQPHTPAAPARAPLGCITQEAVNENTVASVLANLLTPLIKQGKRSSASTDDDENESPTSTEEQDVHDSYHNCGRKYVRQGEPFTGIDKVVDYGVRNEIDDEESDDEFRDTRSTKEIQLLETWEVLCLVMGPNFRKTMISLESTRRIRVGVCNKISNGANSARGDDTAGLKQKILGYLNFDITVALHPSILGDGAKSDRGWNHPVTAALLCPLEYPATPQTYDDIIAGVKAVDATKYPRFLYPDGRTYDRDDIESGILEGHLVQRVAKHIYQGPAAALKPAGFHRGKRGNAAITGITAMTPRTIAYAAVQARFAISSNQYWAKVDGEFDYEVFFWAIVGLFDEGEGKEIIDRYDHLIFGTRMAASPENPTLPPAMSDLDILKAQCAAKRARLEAASDT